MADENHEFIAKLTDNARTSLKHAEAIARGTDSSHIGTEHILLGIVAQGSSVGAKLLIDMGVTVARLERALGLQPTHLGQTPSPSTGTLRSLSDTAVLTLKMAYQFAQQLNQEYLGTEHMLYSILQQQSARATIALKEIGVDATVLIGELDSYLDKQQTEYEEMLAASGGARSEAKNTGLLDVFGTDVTEKARAGKCDIVIGREREIERMIAILSRRTKSNPLLVGEPGVGKTAVVEGLALAVAREDVPEHMLDMRVIELDLASMVAGTKYRGEFEDRLKKVIAEVKSKDNTVVFVDEIHLLVGAGSAEGSMDAANILKPALARGDIRLIGATTHDEYTKYIEKDSALERRFQRVTVKEPTTDQAITIVKGLKSYYEEHHGVMMSDELIEYAVRLSERYVFDRYMPDKAIDVIDEAAAHARVKTTHKPSKVRSLNKQLDQLKHSIEDAVADQNFERAALYKTRLLQLEQKIADLKEKQEKRQSVVLSEQHVAHAVAVMTGIPVQKIQRSEIKQLRSLESVLAKHIIGQDEALKLVSSAIRRGRSGVSSQKRPVGSFVLLGPTGTGKTELAKVLAREVFGREDALVKIDMSEYREGHSAAKLLGAPAGYVGYDDGGSLTDRIRRQPYSVVLFDEIEKAHPDVFNLLLQVLEDGELTDGHGRTVRFSNTIILLTSNLGADSMEREAQLGFNVAKKDANALEALHERNSSLAIAELEGFMRPELLQRFDGVVVFKALSRKHVVRILEKYISELQDRLAIQGLGVRVTPATKKYIVTKGYDAKHGARPLRRAFETHIEHAIADYMLLHTPKRGDMMVVSMKKGEVMVEVENESLKHD